MKTDTGAYFITIKVVINVDGPAPTSRVALEHVQRLLEAAVEGGDSGEDFITRIQVVQ